MGALLADAKKEARGLTIVSTPKDQQVHGLRSNPF